MESDRLINFPTPASDRGAALLTSLENKLQLVRDRVQGVVEGYQAGLFLWGEGGTSKSFTVETTLRQLGTPYKLTNSRVTGKGLFLLLRDFPDAVHVIEDAETLFADKNAFGVLRSALWGQAGPDGQQERVVCWQTAKDRDEFVFTGGIILVANVRLDDIPQARAVKTRIPCLHYQLTNPEVAALMRVIAHKGHRWGPYHLSPEKCLEVAEVIIDRSTRLTKNLDLRLLVNTFSDRLQYENGSSRTHWLDLLESRMKERVTAPVSGCGLRASKNALEVEVAGRIRDLPTPERLAVWTAETGKSRAEMYRALAKVSGPSQLSQVSQPSQRPELRPDDETENCPMAG